MVGILLLLMLFIALLDCLVRKDFRHSLLFAVPIVILMGIYVWFFTSLPVRLGLKRIPFIEQAQISSILADGHTDIPYGGMLELVANEKLDEDGVVLKGSEARHVSWNDFADKDSLAVLTSYEVTFIKEVDGKFLYKAFFTTRQSHAGRTSDSIYCKVFMVRMFAPVYETNEFVVPSDGLLNK